MPDSALNVAATTRLATEASDPWCPRYRGASDTGDRREYGFDAGDVDDTGALTATLRLAGRGFNPTPELDDAVLAHAIALVQRLPSLGLMPTREAEDHIQELQWGRIRCLFAGLGHPYHAPIVEAMHDVSPWCPMDETEDLAAWTKAWQKAHQSSGWPAGLLRVTWEAISFAVTADEDARSTDWIRTVAVAHVLKHLRLDSRPGASTVIAIYRGEYAECDTAEKASQIVGQGQADWLARKLGASTKHSPLHKAVRDLLVNMNPTNLLRQQTLAELPPQVFFSPGAHLAPDVSSMVGYFQTGFTLRGVKVATAGRVIDYADWHGTAGDVLNYTWPDSLPKDCKPEDDAAWREAMPVTYSTEEWPSQILRSYFPNLEFISEAHAALFDSALVAQMIRPLVPRLRVEFPLICLLPKNPTPSDSTKQGKSTAAKAILAAISPASLYMKVSGQDQIATRNANWRIARTGSIGFDEFKLGSNPASPTHTDRLQALCTGGEVDLPTVRENEGGAYRLRAPIVLSTKMLDVPEDIQNRCLIFWMDRLPPEAWANQRKYFEAVNGALGAFMRLSALGMAEKYDLAGWLSAQEISSAEDAFRYPMHRQLAAAIHGMRTHTRDPFKDVDQTVRQMIGRLNDHNIAAEDSHLAATMEDGAGNVRLGIEGLVDAFDENAMRQFCARLAAETDKTGGRGYLASPLQILRARAGMIGPTVGASLTDGLKGLLPEALRSKTDKSLASALARSLKSRLQASTAEDGSVPLPGMLGLSGWRILPGPPMAENRFLVRIYNDIPGHPWAIEQKPTRQKPIA